MAWYNKLKEYFPIEELKSREHIEVLLKEKSDVYHKDESDDHVLMYVEFNDFIFVDYIYVSPKTRGKGIGHQLIEKLKQRDKPIILEVEPVDSTDEDSEKRRRFYEREGFRHARSIGYRRRSLATNTVNELEILYWSPHQETEEDILQYMKQTYENIHTYKDDILYGQSYQPADDVFVEIKDRDKESKKEEH